MTSGSAAASGPPGRDEPGGLPQNGRTPPVTPVTPGATRRRAAQSAPQAGDSAPRPATAQVSQAGTTLTGYGLGEFANALALATLGTFLAYYYVEVGLLGAAAVGTLFLAVRVWDALIHPAAGSLVGALQRRRRVPYRAFVVVLVLPALALGVLTFNLPGTPGRWLGLVDWPAEAGGRILYAYAAYAAFVLVHALLSLPYGALAPSLARSGGERNKLAAARALGAAFGGVFAAFVLAPMVGEVTARQPLTAASRTPTGEPFTADALQASWDALAGHGGATLDEAITAHHAALQAAFTNTTLAFLALGTICYLLTSYWCRETTVAALRVSPTQVWRTFRTNPALRILAGATALALAGSAATVTVGAFYARWILGGLDHLPSLVLASTIAAFVMTPLVPTLIRRLRPRAVFQLGAALQVAGGVGLWFVPEQPQGTGTSTSVLFALALLLLLGAGTALTNGGLFGLASDVVEYGEWKTGQRAESAVFTTVTLARKVALAVGGAFALYVLAWGGYVPTLELIAAGTAQPEGGLRAIKFAVWPLAALFAALGMVVITRYPIGEELLGTIRTDNERLKLSKATALARRRAATP